MKNIKKKNKKKSKDIYKLKMISNSTKKKKKKEREKCNSRDKGGKIDCWDKSTLFKYFFFLL